MGREGRHPSPAPLWPFDLMSRQRPRSCTSAEWQQTYTQPTRPQTVLARTRTCSTGCGEVREHLPGASSGPQAAGQPRGDDGGDAISLRKCALRNSGAVHQKSVMISTV